MKHRKWTPYMFLLPALLGLLLFKAAPLLSAVWNSLFQLRFLQGGKQFVGLGNYRALVEDPMFWSALRVTLKFNLIVNPLVAGLAFALAMLINRRMRAAVLVRSILFIPIAISVPTACIIWGIMLSPEKGVVNSLLLGIGLDQQPFLASAKQALGSMIGIVAWQSTAYWAIFLWAGLQEVPKSLHEAAALDGASAWGRFKHVTFPLMRRPFTFVAVSVTTANFLLFSPMYIMTQGGPQNSTLTLMLESFNSAFLYSDPGRASAIVVVLLVIASLIAAVQFILLKARH